MKWNNGSIPHNRTAQVSGREEDYHTFKEEKAALLIDTVAQRYPGIKTHALSLKTATPLTFRDYMGAPDGSIYGMMPDVRNPMQTRVRYGPKYRTSCLPARM